MLGMIDWGIGGISIYRLVKQRKDNVPVLYFSDTGAMPYGKMGRGELVARLNSVISFLKDRGATHIVIGCNAASTAIPHLDDQGLVVEGVIEPAVKVANSQKPQRLGVIGGRRTVVSGVYRKAFARHGIDIEQRIAQPLSGLIESGDVSSNHLRNEAARILKPLRNCSHILLACTHYPAIVGVLKECVSPETKFIDPAEELALRIGSLKFDNVKNDQFFTTGDSRTMKTAAKRAFGVKIEIVTRIKLRG